jgi:hypothetical protein
MTENNEGAANAAPGKGAGMIESIESIEASQPVDAPKPNEKLGLIAPRWHTALLLHSARQSVGSHHLANYGITIAWEWALAGIAYWGLRLKKTPLREVLGERRRGASEFFVDAGIAGVFWIASLMLLAIVAILLKLLHLESAQKQISQLAPSSIAEVALVDRAQRLRRNLRRVCLSRILSAAVRARNGPLVGRRAGLCAALWRRARL